jgi:predicted phage tail protein
MMTKIKLHGKLSKDYGDSFEFSNINKPSDVVKAIECILPGFRDSIINASKKGGHYEIIVNGKSKNAFELNQKEKNINQVDIVPCLMGHGGGALAVVLGIVAVGIGISATSVAVSAFFIALGVGLIIAGIMYLLTPIPENEPNEASIRASIRNSSFLFQNPSNTAVQGRAIPIVYGQLRVGSYVVGTSVTNFELHEDTQLQRRFSANNTNALLKIQKSFGSSISELYRT